LTHADSSKDWNAVVNGDAIRRRKLAENHFHEVDGLANQDKDNDVGNYEGSATILCKSELLEWFALLIVANSLKLTQSDERKPPNVAKSDTQRNARKQKLDSFSPAVSLVNAIGGLILRFKFDETFVFLITHICLVIILVVDECQIILARHGD
jgi:hypothetical protein